MRNEANKTVIVVGSGGREHALAWKLAQSPQVKRLIVAPGNAGMPRVWERMAFPVAASLAATAEDRRKDRRLQFEDFARHAKEAQADLVVVGPDNPLAEGLVDVLDAQGILAFGPNAAAARIEASKAFAKEVMQSAAVPTARHWVARSIEEARKILSSVPWGAGWVVKADGLALGKGVRVCSTREEALEAATELSRISAELVIEERLVGEELSWMAFCDGTSCALLEPARDYKRVNDGDQGPNTGGMGAFSPVPGIPEGFAERVRREVFLPTLSEMKKRGMPFRGLLYAGLMADFESNRYWVLEFNARWGDPETQVLLPRIAGDIYPWFESCARGKLSVTNSVNVPTDVPFVRESAVFVVGAARGYPESPEKGKLISGLSANPMEHPEGLFTAGVALASGNNTEDELVSAGGRVFGALGMGATLELARERAYERFAKVHFEGMHFRSDVGRLSQPKMGGRV